MPTIGVDHEVFAWLGQRRDPDCTYNDVIRGQLGLPPLPPLPPSLHVVPPRPWSPPLLPLIQAGLLQPGQVLTWHRPRRRKLFTVTVSDQGSLVTADGLHCKTPNVAARVVAGYSAKGWLLWQTADGTSLEELRNRLQGMTHPNPAAGESSTHGPTSVDTHPPREPQPETSPAASLSPDPDSAREAPPT
ncbi:hypothetical protein ACN28G_00390 [Micromonospora sp. WMMA1923]|uniref:restriction system modified-DNA reader domain-containing protein n=1 Tax=Micromonospora sp. WMMA1923 TaxID=3404125 RepID=UPI003B9544CC